MSSSGHRSPRLPLPEEKIHHEASASEQKEDDVVPGIKDAPPAYEERDQGGLPLSAEKIHHEASTSEQKQDDVVVEIEDDAPADEEIEWADSILLANRNFEGEEEHFVTIPRVPERLRQGDNDAFEPNIISIGPYHYGKPRLQPMEKHKRHSVEAILQRNPRCTLANYIHQIKRKEITARSRYSEKIALESKEFVEMLLFDGCFVVEYLLKRCPPNLMDDGVLDTRTWMDDAIRNDLLLLENQLPFFIVEDIYARVTGEHPNELMEFAYKFFERVSPINMSGLTCVKPRVHNFLVYHLLHLYHWFLFSSTVLSEQERPVLSEQESSDLSEPVWTLNSSEQESPVLSKPVLTPVLFEQESPVLPEPVLTPVLSKQESPVLSEPVLTPVLSEQERPVLTPVLSEPVLTPVLSEQERLALSEQERPVLTEQPRRWTDFFSFLRPLLCIFSFLCRPMRRRMMRRRRRRMMQRSIMRRLREWSSPMRRPLFDPNRAPRPNRGSSLKDKGKRPKPTYRPLFDPNRAPLFGPNRGSSLKDKGKRLKPTYQGSSSKKLKWTIPSATFLEEAGIKFREKTEVTASLIDATFERGVMKITPLFIDAFTVSQFRNLIALEKFDPYIEPQVLAFSQFMDYIINTSKDVSLLRRKGIIEHAFGSNEEVATIFNQLTSGTLEYHPPELTEMYEKVDEYCKTRRHRWRKIFMRDYVGNPWAVFALQAGAFLLVLTFLQTFFSMYSYFRPPSAN